MNIMMMIAMMMRMMMIAMMIAMMMRDSSGLDPLGARGFEILAHALKKKQQRRVAADLTRSQIKSDTLQRT